MIERFLIEHCSATLASIKAANLCNMTFSSKEELEDQISYCLSGTKRNSHLCIAGA